METILLLFSDLFFENKIRDAAKHVGLAVESRLEEESVPAALARTRPALAIISLVSPNWRYQVADVQEARVKILAFGPHVDRELFNEAREMGCDKVVSRHYLSAQLPQVLLKATGGEVDESGSPDKE